MCYCTVRMAGKPTVQLTEWRWSSATMIDYRVLNISKWFVSSFCTMYYGALYIVGCVQTSSLQKKLGARRDGNVRAFAKCPHVSFSELLRQRHGISIAHSNILHQAHCLGIARPFPSFSQTQSATHHIDPVPCVTFFQANGALRHLRPRDF